MARRWRDKSFIPWHEIAKLQDQEFEVECDGQVFRLKPEKVWTTAKEGDFGSVIAIFRCPNGKKVRKCLGFTYRPLYEVGIYP